MQKVGIAFGNDYNKSRSDTFVLHFAFCILHSDCTPSLIRPLRGHLEVNCPEGARETTLGCPQRGRLWALPRQCDKLQFEKEEPL